MIFRKALDISQVHFLPALASIDESLVNLCNLHLTAAGCIGGLRWPLPARTCCNQCNVNDF